MIVLYSNHCPLCNNLKEELDKNKITYTEENDVSKMIALGIDRTPRLGVDDKLLTYKEALQWLTETR